MTEPAITGPAMPSRNLNGFGRFWTFCETLGFGVWGFACPEPMGEVEPSAEDRELLLPDRLRLALQLPFLVGIGIVLIAWSADPPAERGPLAAVWAFAAAFFLLSFRIRRRVFDRTVLVVQILVLDRWYHLLQSWGIRTGQEWDRFFLDLDARIFGRLPITLGEWTDTAGIEFFSFTYFMFIPILFTAFILGAFGRELRTSGAWVFGLAVLYSISYLGYAFLPTSGPVTVPAYSGPLPGGEMYAFLEKTLDHQGTRFGAFPSLHTGAMVYIVSTDFFLCRRRFWVFLPWAVAIAISTMVLRHHYLIDLVFGVAFAALGTIVCLKSLCLTSHESLR